jgi:NAD(P)-dependent dehydrogenase (short-subunit alcohol dehydrogenase family)
VGCLSLTEKIFPKKFSLKNKIAIVVGGAGLIGKPVSIGLAQAGAKVYIADIDKKNSLKLEKQNKDIKWIKIDITDIKSIISCIKKVLKEDKKIDIWVNIAYPKTSDWSTKFEDIKYESWKTNVDMHLNGYFLCCQKVAELMKKQRGGVIINFGSIYGVVGPDFSIYEKTNYTMPAAYSAIKGGIITFTKYLATYLAKYNIRVNAICPGGIYNNQSDIFVKNYEEKTPMRRMGKPEEIAGPVIFLASDASSYITGQILMVDGGWTAW